MIFTWQWLSPCNEICLVTIFVWSWPLPAYKPADDTHLDMIFLRSEPCLGSTVFTIVLLFRAYPCPLAYFPAVFFHICNFDICHEIQHAVVTPHRAYQNDCSSFLGWNSRSGKLCLSALRTPTKEAKKRKSIRIQLRNHWAGFQEAGVARNALKMCYRCLLLVSGLLLVSRMRLSVWRNGCFPWVFNLFLPIFCSFTLLMHT